MKGKRREIYLSEPPLPRPRFALDMWWKDNYPVSCLCEFLSLVLQPCESARGARIPPPCPSPPLVFATLPPTPLSIFFTHSHRSRGKQQRCQEVCHTYQLSLVTSRTGPTRDRGRRGTLSGLFIPHGEANKVLSVDFCPILRIFHICFNVDRCAYKKNLWRKIVELKCRLKRVGSIKSIFTCN